MRGRVMKKPESKLYEKLVKLFEAYPIIFHRIENDAELGTPDLHYTTENNEGWVELKVIKSMPKKKETGIKIPFRPGQYSWLRNRYWLNKNTSNWLVIQVEDMFFAFKNKGIKETYTRSELLSMCTIKGYMNGLKEVRHSLYVQLNRIGG